MEILFLWVGLAVVVGIVAANKGRSGFAWFLLAVVISPLLAGLTVLAVANLATERSPRTGYQACPECGEMARAKARVCPHCRCDLIPGEIALERDR